MSSTCRLAVKSFGKHQRLGARHQIAPDDAACGSHFHHVEKMKSSRAAAAQVEPDAVQPNGHEPLGGLGMASCAPAGGTQNDPDVV